MYKRQEDDIPPLATSKISELDTALNGKVPTTRTAVSYTHLDVYKRQEHYTVMNLLALILVIVELN